MILARIQIAALVLATTIVACQGRFAEPRDPCDGVDCSDHGDCLDNEDLAMCACDDGYVADGLECVEVGADGDADVDADSDVDGDGDADEVSDGDSEPDVDPETCLPACTERECGSDGCGGACPPGCSAPEACDEGTGHCECEPECGDRECGPDNCDGSCGECSRGEACRDGFCELVCGSIGEPCCPRDLSCHFGVCDADGMCVPCGAEGEPCCPPDDTCLPTLDCSRGTCIGAGGA